MIDSAPIHIGGPTEEALFAWRAGRLHPEAAEWIGAHVDGCARCRAAMDHLEAVHAALEPPPEPPFLRQRQIGEVRRRLAERPTRRVPWRQMKWAALAGAVAGFALVFALHPRRPVAAGATASASRWCRARAPPTSRSATITRSPRRRWRCPPAAG